MHTRFTKKELRSVIVAQRADLIKIVGSLNAAQLQHPSLCRGWNVDNVLGHILGFELSRLDLALLLLRIKKLDDITADQAKRYQGLSAQEYCVLLQKGTRRVVRLINITPARLLNVKFIPVPHGRLSMGQLFGDVVLDRAIHMLDITHPLGLGSTIDDAAVLRVGVGFVFQCLDLLEHKIPEQYYGSIVRLRITGHVSGDFDWVIGGKGASAAKPKSNPVLTANADCHDLLCTVAVRKSLVKNQIVFKGDAALAQILRDCLSANALWDS